MYSAIKKDGQPLYKLARQGVDIALEARPVTIHEIKVLLYNQESAMLEVRCSKGTYIRTLCQDIGRACGSSAYMAYLMRTASGTFGIADAVPLAKLEQTERPEQYLRSMNDCLADMPALYAANELMEQRISNGLSQRVPGVETLAGDTVCRVLGLKGQLLAIGYVSSGSFQPNKVFRSGEVV